MIGPEDTWIGIIEEASRMYDRLILLFADLLGNLALYSLSRLVVTLSLSYAALNLISLVVS